MAAPNTFVLPTETVSGWIARLAAWRSLKSVDESLRDMESAVAKTADGKVTLTRHQVWTWAETMQGAAAKLPLAGGDAAKGLATELRAILSGQPAPPAAAAASPPPPAPPVGAVATGLSWESPRPAAPAYSPAPPVTYIKPAAAAAAATSPSGPASLRLVPEKEIGATVQQMIRGARQEVLVLSPWRGGMDSLLPELQALPVAVAVRLITRAPQPDDPAYHRAMADLRRRGVDVAVSPYVHTRMVIVDAQQLLLGAASIPGPQTAYSREVALLTTDAKAVGDARLHFATVQKEVRGEY